MVENNKFGKELKRLLVVKKLTQKGFAKEIGVSENTVYNWCRGKAISLEGYQLVVNYFKDLPNQLGDSLGRFDEKLISELKSNLAKTKQDLDRERKNILKLNTNLKEAKKQAKKDIKESLVNLYNEISKTCYTDQYGTKAIDLSQIKELLVSLFKLEVK